MKTKTNKVLKSVIALILMLLMACSVTVPTLAAGYESTRYKGSPNFYYSGDGIQLNVYELYYSKGQMCAKEKMYNPSNTRVKIDTVSLSIYDQGNILLATGTFRKNNPTIAAHGTATRTFHFDRNHYRATYLNTVTNIRTDFQTTQHRA